MANPPFGASVSDGVETNYPAQFRCTESADLFLLLMIRYLQDGGRAAIVLPDGSLTGDDVKQRIREEFLAKCDVHTIVRLPNSVFQPYASVATNLLFFSKGKPTREIWYYEHRLPEGQKSYSKTKPIRESGFNLDIKNPFARREEQQYTTSELLTMLSQSLERSARLVGELEEGK